MKSADIVSRERLGEAVGNLIEGLDVDKAERLVMCHLLAEPVVTRIEPVASRCCMRGVEASDSGGAFEVLRVKLTINA
jgi:hypothetical protein